jgi:hypothetical protein
MDPTPLISQLPSTPSIVRVVGLHSRRVGWMFPFNQGCSKFVVVKGIVHPALYDSLRSSSQCLMVRAELAVLPKPRGPAAAPARPTRAAPPVALQELALNLPNTVLASSGRTPAGVDDAADLASDTTGKAELFEALLRLVSDSSPGTSPLGPCTQSGQGPNGGVLWPTVQRVPPGATGGTQACWRRFYLPFTSGLGVAALHGRGAADNDRPVVTAGQLEQHGHPWVTHDDTAAAKGLMGPLPASLTRGRAAQQEQRAEQQQAEQQQAEQQQAEQQQAEQQQAEQLQAQPARAQPSSGEELAAALTQMLTAMRLGDEPLTTAKVVAAVAAEIQRQQGTAIEAWVEGLDGA